MEALLITRQDIVKYSSLNGNLDTDKMQQFIKMSQDIHLERILGSDLLNRIKADIIAGTLADPYLTLLTKYIKPMLIHWSLVEIIPFNAYQIANGGIFKHNSENSDSVSKNEVDFLMEKYRKVAEHYTTRFQDYMCFHSSQFPEWNSNSEEDMYPANDTPFSGWVL
jgi:hypothetical protein